MADSLADRVPGSSLGSSRGMIAEISRCSVATMKTYCFVLFNVPVVFESQMGGGLPISWLSYS